jgi:hypothetical protein
LGLSTFCCWAVFGSFDERNKPLDLAEACGLELAFATPSSGCHSRRAACFLPDLLFLADDGNTLARLLSVTDGGGDPRFVLVDVAEDERFLL